MNTKYNVGQEISTVVEATETICGIKVNTKGAVMYNMKSGKTYTEEALSKIVVEDKLYDFTAEYLDGHNYRNVASDDLEPYTEPEQKEPIKLYCTKSGWRLTEGRVYEFSGGKLHYDDFESASNYKSLEDFLRQNQSADSCLVPLVSRPAKVGEWIIPISGDGHGAELNVPCKVTLEAPSGRGAYVSANDLLWHSQYLVLDGYSPEPFKPYLELCGEIMGYIGENSPSTAYGNVPLKVGDTILVTSGCENGKEKLIVGKKEAGSLSSTAENGNWWFGRSVKIRNYTELKDGETVDGITAHLTEKGE